MSLINLLGCDDQCVSFGVLPISSTGKLTVYEGKCIIVATSEGGYSSSKTFKFQVRMLIRSINKTENALL